MHADITEYNEKQEAADKEICDALAAIIDSSLPKAESKIWHAHPVWFLDGNPIVGYHKLKNCVRLLFWSGQSFDEEALQNEGSFKWDYKNIVKRKGVLERLESRDYNRKTKGLQKV